MNGDQILKKYHSELTLEKTEFKDGPKFKENMMKVKPENQFKPKHDPLKPKIKTDDVWKPESQAFVKVSEENGKEMAYTLAIVDEGLLDITRFKTPDPWKAFYAKEALGVKTWDIYDNVIGAFGNAMSRILSE